MIFMAICDDDEVFVNSVAEYCRKKYKNEIAFKTYTRCTDLWYAMEFEELLFDCVFMDIKFDDGDGIEVMKKIQEVSPKTRVVYITGYIQNCTRIFETKPSNFLVKPLDYAQLAETIEKMKREILTEEERCVSISVITIDRVWVTVPMKAIVYIESDRRRLIIHTESAAYSFYDTLNNFEEKIMRKGNQGFVRCHQSYLLNMRYIAEKAGMTFVLTTGERIPISRTRSVSIKEQYADFLGASLWE